MMSDTGHAKNIANFETLINFVSSLGAVYNPTNPNLSVESMTTLLKDSKVAITELQTQFSGWKDATNQRERAFESVGQLATRALNSFAVCGVTELTVQDAKASYRKLMGRRASKKAEPKTAGEAVKTHSAAQTGYDNKVEHFAQIVSHFEQSDKYKPNETELQTVSLNTVLTDLRQQNANVRQSTVALSNARQARNTLLYDAETGIVRTAGDVKKYIKSVFGPSSAQFKQISGLVFKSAH